MLAAGLLTTIGSFACGEGTGEVEGHDAERPEPIPVIVNLAVDVGEGSLGDSAVIAAVRAPVIERLQETLSAEDFAAVRTFENLPAIALSAEPKVIALLLALPQVASIEADREFLLWDTMSSGFR
ncbi:MAG: hypothetical protein OXQ31_03940 [Spirochaetaceae bacterium]|nr:hypothetical protein [Spirochaetaceae bacterium]